MSIAKYLERVELLLLSTSCINKFALSTFIDSNWLRTRSRIIEVFLTKKQYILLRFEVFLNNFDLKNQKTFDLKKKRNISQINNLSNDVALFKILKSINKRFDCELRLKESLIIKFRRDLIIDKRDIENCSIWDKTTILFFDIVKSNLL